MRRTSDQQAAIAALRAQARPYRVTLDAEGWPMIAGRHGQIEHHDEATLAAVLDRSVEVGAAPGGRRDVARLHHMCAATTPRT
jgi:hypothetical protein